MDCFEKKQASLKKTCESRPRSELYNDEDDDDDDDDINTEPQITALPRDIDNALDTTATAL